SKYLVNSFKCKIIDLDPFDAEAKKFHRVEKYVPCSNLELLTYVTKKDNIATLHINTKILPFYSKNEIVCLYANIRRHEEVEDPDNFIGTSKYLPFKDNVTLNENFVAVECRDIKTNKLIYENTHSVIIFKNHTIQKSKMFANKIKPFSVLMIGIDGISRLNFIRSLPNSHKFLMNNGWISLKGYNKIDDNTFPNVMAFLTGYDKYSAFEICEPQKTGKLNLCPIIWNDFNKLGYITGYAEDESWISTFNHEKKGFVEPPTDYYFRPYILKSEKLNVVRKDDMMYCTGPETTGERMLNIVKDFVITFKDSPSFSLFWMNSFSHNSLNAASRMDDKIKQFWEEITYEGVLNNSFVIFLSDHGLRCGQFRETAMGWLEERLPFIYVWIPDRFKQKYPSEFINFKRNVHKLTTPFDLYMTLQHLLILENFIYEMKPSRGCPNCKSLFTEIESERSCNDAGIAQHWCTCADFSPLDEQDEPIVDNACHFVIEQVHSIIDANSEDDQCATYSLQKVIKAGVFKSYNDEKYLLLIIETKPKALFETTLGYHGVTIPIV
ncbi:DUF229, Sulfatase, and/or Phosphodiest domain containing protein, partial [Asbolus verrucosus]